MDENNFNNSANTPYRFLAPGFVHTFMRFSKWLETKINNINKVGKEISSDVSLIRGPKAWNQSEQNCYAIASKLALKFGYEPVSADSLRAIIDQYKRYWLSSHVSWMSAPEPRPPKPGVANFIVRIGDELMMHVTFEYRGKEYNYSALPEDFKVIFKMGLKPLAK